MEQKPYFNFSQSKRKHITCFCIHLSHLCFRLSSYRWLRLFNAGFLLNPVLTHKALILSECVLIMEKEAMKMGKRRPVRKFHISMRNATEAQHIYLMLWGVIANWILCSVFSFPFSVLYHYSTDFYIAESTLLIFWVLLVCLLLFHFNWV